MAKKVPDREVAPIRHVADGRIFIREYTPHYPEHMHWSSGIKGVGIYFSDDYLLGRESVNSKGEIIKCDKRLIYGEVVGCGKLMNRSSTEQFSPEKQLDFPLPRGTLVKISRTVDYKVTPYEDSYNTYDCHEWCLPGEVRNPEIWGLAHV